MMTSLFSSRSPLFRLLALALALAGCSDGSGGDGEEIDCFNAESPSIPSFPEAAVHLGRITLSQETSFAADGLRADDTWLTADFADYSEVVVHSRQPTLVATPGCYGLTGTGTTVCRDGFTEPCSKYFMPVASVAVSGLAGGQTQLTANSEGKFSLGGLATPLFVAPTVEVTVGAAAGGTFPSYAQSITPPDLLQLSAPVPSTATPLGAHDLDLRWEPGNGDYVVINISSTASSDKIQCIVEDDGCHSIQQGDLEFFDITDGIEFKVSLVRERSGIQSLDDKTAVELTAATKVELILLK